MGGINFETNLYVAFLTASVMSVSVIGSDVSPLSKKGWLQMLIRKWKYSKSGGVESKLTREKSCDMTLSSIRMTYVVPIRILFCLLYQKIYCNLHEDVRRQQTILTSCAEVDPNWLPCLGDDCVESHYHMFMNACWSDAAVGGTVFQVFITVTS